MYYVAVRFRLHCQADAKPVEKVEDWVKPPKCQSIPVHVSLLWLPAYGGTKISSQLCYLPSGDSIGESIYQWNLYFRPEQSSRSDSRS